MDARDLGRISGAGEQGGLVANGNAVPHPSLDVGVGGIAYEQDPAAVRRFRQTIAKAGEKLIVLSTRETGRPTWETRQELGQTLGVQWMVSDARVGLSMVRLSCGRFAEAEQAARSVVLTEA